MAFIEWAGDTLGVAGALAAGDHGLHPGAEAHYQGNRHEVGVAAQAHTCQRLAAQAADHGGVHQVKQALAQHAAHDRQPEHGDTAQPCAGGEQGHQLS